jgi:hypothetical protein
VNSSRAKPEKSNSWFKISGLVVCCSGSGMIISTWTLKEDGRDFTRSNCVLAGQVVVSQIFNLVDSLELDVVGKVLRLRGVHEAGGVAARTNASACHVGKGVASGTGRLKSSFVVVGLV